MEKEKTIRCELFNDNFQNYKRYGIPKAQLVIADIPYNIGNNFYGSNPNWYVGGDNHNGESKLAGKAAFNTDFNFNIAEYFHFCNKLLKKEPKSGGARGKSSDAPCMIVFCSWEQQETVRRYAEKHGFIHCIPLVFIKNYSPQALKANMRIVGATEYALLLFRSYLPKFRNEKWIDAKGVEHGKMVFNWFEYEKDGKEIPKLHPTQKPVKLLKTLIKTFTDEGDVVIDPVAGSGSTLRACLELGRNSYGFEVGKAQYQKVMNSTMLNVEAVQNTLF
jgi:site-specific DNA-methyltransferase (adenine-specific)